MLGSAGCEANESPASGRAESAPAECYSFEQVPELGIVEEESQWFVDLDDDGRVLLDASPTEHAQDIGQSMQTAYLWDGGAPRAITIEGFFQTHALDMNDRGEVLILASPMAGWVPPWTDAFVWRDGAVVARISAPSGLRFQYGWINERGHVALSTFFGESGPARAFWWQDGELVKLGTGQVRALNDADEIAGFDPEVGAVVRWQAAAERTELATLCDSPLAWAGEVLIDSHGRIAADVQCGPEQRGLIWEGELARELPSREGSAFFPLDMNDRGEIVGRYYVYTGEEEEEGGGLPVLWDGGDVIDIPLPDGAASGVARSINEQGLIAGEYEDGFFVGTAEATKALPLESVWANLLGRRINERGDIVNTMAGDEWYGGGAFRWRPTPCEDVPPSN
ncbi:hypothetical protein [Nannocystis punicea]|uniref:WG containing repeat-containing protein n=1 Tax=Nannocystis punicea TaxID=2995304 RepID=A0ABY7HB63_9BACT|nr:hypothetical protein [Nannocystis poenicansa]WAS96365.1 hypothetical protein O0S08_09410 [Nannocystis poenicansa]